MAHLCFRIEPTVFSGVRNDMRIARGEIFGPVLVVIRYDNEKPKHRAHYGGDKCQERRVDPGTEREISG